MENVNRPLNKQPVLVTVWRRPVSLCTGRLNLSLSDLLLHFLPFPSLFSCHHRLLITNNNRHVWSICCWTNIKWVRAAKFVWRDITFSWEGELEAESVQRLSQQMLSGSPALIVLPRCPHVPIPAHLLCLVAFQPPPLYPALYPPLCPTLALLNPLAMVHTHTLLCYVKAVV